MKKLNILALVLTLALSVCLAGLNLNSAGASGNDFDCTYSAGEMDHVTNLRHYGSTEVITYTEQEAADAQIPTGFSDSVVSVVGYANKGALLDFSSKSIEQRFIKSITFRVYVGNDGRNDAGYPEIRIPKPYEVNAWTLRYNMSDKKEVWTDIVLSGTAINDLCTDGYLDKFELAVRSNGKADAPFYIDSVKVALMENDFVAPTINYVGEDNLTVAYKQELSFNVTATDSIDGEVEVEQIWGDLTKFDDDGNPLPGTHTLTFKAVDIHGNVAEKTITITVQGADTVPPTIDVNVSVIYAKVGTTPRISVTASDDSGNVTVVYSWTEGALDARGRFYKEGQFVLTIIATDASKNEARWPIVFMVSANGDSSNVIVDEEALCQDESEDESEDESVDDSEEISEEESSETAEESSETAEESSVESEESSEPVTSETVSEATTEESPSSSTEEKKGCKGSVGATPILLVFALIGGVLLKKRS